MSDPYRLGESTQRIKNLQWVVAARDERIKRLEILLDDAITLLREAPTGPYNPAWFGSVNNFLLDVLDIAALKEQTK